MLKRLVGDLLDHLSVLLCEAIKKMFNETWDLLTPLTKWRNIENGDSESIVQVFTEFAIFNKLCQICIRRRDHSYVDLFWL